MLNRDQGSKKRRKPPTRLLELDAWLDSALYATRTWFASFWEVATIWSRRMHVTGFKRVIIEVLDEGFTFGVAGVVVLLALAVPFRKLQRIGARALSCL